MSQYDELVGTGRASALSPYDLKGRVLLKGKVKLKPLEKRDTRVTATVLKRLTTTDYSAALSECSSSLTKKETKAKVPPAAAVKSASALPFATLAQGTSYSFSKGPRRGGKLELGSSEEKTVRFHLTPPARCPR